MREIEFRGKRTKNGKWVTGYYVANRLEHCIVSPQEMNAYYTVIPETVGQYTGLLDKNGAKIFEGDILKQYHFTDNKNRKHFLYNVVGLDIGIPQLWYYMKNDFMVAGNIHDNPELLEEK